MSFGELLFGTDTEQKKRNDLYNKYVNYDNRIADFSNYAGTAINDLANRGIINSSVTSSALGKALNQANNDYYNNLIRAGSLIGQDSMGLMPGLIGGISSGLGQALPFLFL